MGINIPIVSQLAKEAQMRAAVKGKNKTTEDAEMEKEDSKKKITEFIEQDEEQLETHFVENPFIKIREKATRKAIDSKHHMGANDLEEDADTTANQDIYFLKEENKFIVQDLEQMEIDKAKSKDLKRKNRDAFGYGKGEDVSDESDDDDERNGRNNNAGNKRKTNYDGPTVKNSDLGKLQGMNTKSAISQLDSNARQDRAGSSAFKKREMKAQLKQ